MPAKIPESSPGTYATRLAKMLKNLRQVDVSGYNPPVMSMIPDV